MNWIDFVLIGLLLVAIIIGSRRGLFSGLMGILGLVGGVIFAINYTDQITAKFLSHMRVSTVMVVFMEFIVVFVLVYVGIKLLGYLFYKFASLNPLGNVDKVGGAIMGIFQGWIVLGVILFLFIFLPLPDSFVAKLDSSFFAPGMRGVVPMIYDETTFLHPENPSLVEKVKTALRTEPGKSSKDLGGFSAEGSSVSRIIRTMEDYFGT
ncbi:MAG: CvpA family protein [candidate division Zixibacteria bacterium]|nr:CvpA family protein [candidate division Zixibacteria bacterium]